MTDLTLIGAFIGGLRQTFGRRYVKSLRTNATQNQCTAGIYENSCEQKAYAPAGRHRLVAARRGDNGRSSNIRQTQRIDFARGLGRAPVRPTNSSRQLGSFNDDRAAPSAEASTPDPTAVCVLLGAAAVSALARGPNSTGLGSGASGAGNVGACSPGAAAL